MLLPGCCWCTSTCCPMSGWIDHIGAARALPITDLDMQFAVGCQSQSYASQSNVGRTATVEPQPSNQVTSVQMQACHNAFHRESKSIECVQGQDFPPHRIDPAFAAATAAAIGGLLTCNCLLTQICTSKHQTKVSALAADRMQARTALADALQQ
jgi:hypothetical protein